jgi:hypothetical protein
VIAIELLATARNMLPGALADLAEMQNTRGTDVTQVRWAAGRAAAAAVMLRRTVALPAVPRAGDVVYVDPYTEPLTVESVTWTVTPDEGQAHVQLHLSNIDLDVLGDDEDALEMFTVTGWVIDE